MNKYNLTNDDLVLINELNEVICEQCRPKTLECINMLLSLLSHLDTEHDTNEHELEQQKEITRRLRRELHELKLFIKFSKGEGK